MGKSAATTTPKNWPPALPYLTQPTYAPSLTPTQLRSLRARPADPAATPTIPAHHPRGPSPLVRIAPITDPAHPARGQFGLFAARALPPGALVVPYFGLVHPGSDGDGDGDGDGGSDYDLWLDRGDDVDDDDDDSGGGVAVDAARAGNEARFVNDYRGVRGRPNAEFRECWDARRGERCMGVFVLPVGKKGKNCGSGGGIGKGEEILVSYGKGFWGKRRDEDAGDGGVDGEETIT
ncbi:hypothetical protein F5X99DRAFT_427494 [Biscogniauxia marginata]|nr:hypothetical protein F5X99DRAFT_427494 [Biscogniauxia marginata]